MKRELDDKLCKKYPIIFKDRYGDMKQTCMVWGFECGDGWYDIIDGLCAKLELIRKATGMKTVASQVKEKYGTLCFYCHIIPPSGVLSFIMDLFRKLFRTKDTWSDDDGWYNIIHDVIHYTESQSRGICEVCGEWSELRDVGWIYNMCDKCWKKFKKERGIREKKSNSK